MTRIGPKRGARDRRLPQTSGGAKRLLSAYGPAAAIVLAGLLLWELITRGFDVPHYIWSSVSLIAQTIGEEIDDLLSTRRSR